MKLKRALYGPQDPRGPSHGRDVKDFVKRTLNRLPGMLPVGEDFFPKAPGGFDDVYNAKTVDGVRVFQQFTGITPATGHFGQATLDEMWSYADGYSKWVYRIWTAPTPKPLPPELIEPNQGFESLHISLREDFSLGRHMGLSDLGTYNPSSRLPSGAPSDHAVWPAMAFDLGVDPDNGYDNPTGRAFFTAMIGRPEVEYVILGDRIWSRAQGLHSYTSGGHGNHVHVSGNR
jgi:peptidoglycan hydrolase-like protein with peptidoglycan-binding domain